MLTALVIIAVRGGGAATAPRLDERIAEAGTCCIETLLPPRAPLP